MDRVRCEFNGAAFELINSTHEEAEEMSYDAISGEALGGELIREAREAEVETFKKHGVCEKAPTEERWGTAGTGPVGVKWVDASEGDKEIPAQVQTGRQGDKSNEREGLFAATPPLEAKKVLSVLWASVPGMSLDCIDPFGPTSMRRPGHGCMWSRLAYIMKIYSVGRARS